MTHDNNKSDYNKPFMDLLKYLPEPYQSNVNESLVSNLFNRFLTKHDVEKVSGYIGKGNRNAVVSRQIQENDVHRQAFQLQPILSNKIGSVEHMASWKDIQNELERLGVDMDDFANWGAVQTFNWVPPIDINKIVNYRDYYWVDDKNEQPQYITIRSRCATATATKTFWEGIINQYGNTFPVVDVLPAIDNTVQRFDIFEINPTLGFVNVIGDVTDEILQNQFFDITGTVNHNGTYGVLATPTYNGTANTTRFVVSGLIGTIIESQGIAITRQFNRIVFGANDVAIAGDYTILMESGFVLFLSVPNNSELHNTFVKIVDSEYNVDDQTTTIQIENIISNNNFTEESIGSLNEQLSIYNAAFFCLCGVLSGWDDDVLWDDNPESPLWGDSENAAGDPNSPDGTSDHQNLLNRITNPGPPIASGIETELWYDLPAKILYQYSSSIGWTVIWNRFDLLLEATDGTTYWDQVPSCDTSIRIQAVDQWVEKNKWQHKNDITNFASVIRATQPIIEYDWDLELNEWTLTDYNWSYRVENNTPFIETSTVPPVIELEPINWWEVAGNVVVLDFRYGDLTDYFVGSKKIYISGNINNATSIETYEVDYSEYKSNTVGGEYRTYVTFKSVPINSTGNLNALIPNSFMIIPFETVNGDSWKDYGVHWLMRAQDDAVPVPHQEENPYTVIIDDAAWDTSGALYDTRKTIYAQEFRTTSATNVNIFEFSGDVGPTDTRSLRRKSLFGYDDIRVYVSDLAGDFVVRQFGNYSEVEEAVLDVIGIDYTTNELFVENNHAQYFAVGDEIILSNNDSVGTFLFTVDPAHTSQGNRIKVTANLCEPNTVCTGTVVSISGNIHNQSNPLSSYYNGASFIPSQNVTLYTIGVDFMDGIPAGVNVTVAVGPDSINELGSTHNRVRMIADDELYDVNGNVAVSQTKYRKVEQVKTRVNQYPLFDVFTCKGEPAFKANPLFGYRTGSEYAVNVNTGLRIVVDQVNNIYEFDQFLLDGDDAELLAYRDYGTTREDIWYNPDTQEIFFWKDTKWSDKTVMGDFYRRAVISPIEPDMRERGIIGLYWYNTTLNVLYKRVSPDIGPAIWSEIKNVDTVITDKNLQTIWRAGQDNDMYIPEKVDWVRRSNSEYNEAKDSSVEVRSNELLLIDSSLTEAEAIAMATNEWYETESNPLSLSGEWIGDWEIPDPLYYNNLHENRKFLDSRELLTHFKTIIAEQPKIPGYAGTVDGMFALLPLADINYSLGGTIKEFNDGFDTLLSSTFINNVTPPTLAEFAHDQYETLLNSLKEIYRSNSISLLTNIEPDNLLNLSEYVAAETINQYENNDQYAFIYGDSTTFTDVDGENDLGVKNWIATLPYVNLTNKQYPTQIVDSTLGVNEVVHHDGHRNTYELSSATIDIISQIVIKTPDPRTTDNDIGRTSDELPPNNISEFQANYGTVISNREGVYWYYLETNTTNTLYRYVVVESGINVPSSSYDDGTLWMDLTPQLEVLRVKKTNTLGVISWNVVNGLSQGDGRLHNGTDPTDVTTASVSAWQVIDLNALLSDTIFALEKRLYGNVPTFPKLAYNLSALSTLNPTKYDKYLEEAFLDYVSQLSIPTPFKNIEFKIDDAFTWNYKRSAHGGALNIISADGLTNSFLVSGDKVAAFDPCTASGPAFTACDSQVSFFMKNSGVNDGTWKTLSSTASQPTTFYNVVNDTTRIFVEGDVIDSLRGIIYNGLLPSLKSISTPTAHGDAPNNLNDGSESGGDWRDLYTKFYNTPYPNNEPWKLQGYIEKPFWWDEEYLNDDVDNWGERTWKYKSGFDIIAANNDLEDNAGVIAIAGKFFDLFVSTQTLPIDNTLDHVSGYIIGNHASIINVYTGAAGSASIIVDDANHAGIGTYLPGMLFTIAIPTANPAVFTLSKEYTITTVNHSINDLTISVAEEILVGDITIGTFINGVIYNPSTNQTEIKLTGQVDNNNATGRIVKVFGMWENIRIGVIPPNRQYPNGIVGNTGRPYEDTLNGLAVPDLPTFNYFSVNIGNANISADGGVTNYPPDSLFPPFWDYVGVYTSLPANIDAAIRSLFFDFSTEIISPNSNYVFGDVGSVEWKWRTSSQFQYDQLTIAYRIDPTRYVSSTFGFNYTEINNLKIDADVKNTPSHTRTNFHGDIVDDVQFISYGVNQWYINYNRYNGYDANFSDFKELWTGWKAPMTYQFSSFVDTPSLSIAHRFVDVTNFDYAIKSKRAPGVDDFWLDAFKVSIINIPYNLARYDNQIDWRFEVKTNIPVSRNIKYYDVHNYQFYTNPNTNECLLYSWEILELDTFNKIFVISGDQSQIFSLGRQFTIGGSSGNDGTYDVSTVSYDLTSNRTSILVDNNISSSVNDGILRADYRKLPWKTGDGIYFSTSETLPTPLLGDTVNGLTKYFIVVNTDTTFSVAETPADAAAGIIIDISSKGRADHFVGEVISVFNVVNSNTSWRFYAMDKTNTLEFNTPSEVQGMQNLINIINGYDIYVEDSGWVINSDKQQLDPDSSKIINWQVETERFISYAYSQRLIREQINDRYPVSLDGITSVWEFVGDNKTFITGDAVTVISSNGVYPSPLSRNIRYYMIRDTLESFRLAASKQDAENAVAISILSTVGVGDLQISIPREFKTLIPDFEINAFRNAIWFQPPRGIVSDILVGPTEDIRSNQLIYNQNGDRINEDQLRVYRQDKETKISVVDATGNDDSSLISIISPEYALLHMGGLHLFIDAYEHVLVLQNYTSEGNLLYDPFIGLNVTKYEMLFNKQPNFTHRPNVGGYYLETFFNQGASIKENFEASVENLRTAYDTFNTLETNLMTEYSRRGLGYEGGTDYLTNLNLSQKSQFIFWRGQIQNKGSVNAVKAFINSRRFIDAKIDDFWAIKVGEFGAYAEKEFPEMFVTTVDARSNELRLEFIENGIAEENVINVVEETFTPVKMAYQERWYNQPDQTKVLRDNGKIMFFDQKPKNNLTAVIAGGGNDLILNNGKQFIIHNLDCDSVEVTQEITQPTTTLLVAGIHYNIVNNNIIEFIQGGGSSTNNITIWGLVVNDDAQSPARLIDRDSETQVSTIQFWDPARGVHYNNAIHNIDLQNTADPAEYSETMRIVPYKGNWKETFVGTTWMNTKKLDYIPYYSEQMIPDTTERFRSWGRLADWSEYEIFEWVGSDVPPAEWDVLAAKEEGDRTIVEYLRKSGIARKLLLEPDPNIVSPSPWIPAENIIKLAYPAIDADIVDAGANYLFSDVFANVSDFYRASNVINVYVNGKLYSENAQYNDINTYKISTVDLKEADVVHFIQLIPTTQTDIATAGMIQDYEYTKVDQYDELGTLFSKYYFWVSSKRTKPVDRNRTMPTAEATIQLNSIPSAHLFFQKSAPADSIASEDENFERAEVNNASGGPESFTLEVERAAGTTLLVEVNGFEQPDDNSIYTVDNITRVVTLFGVAYTANPNTGLVPIVSGDTIKMSYVAIFNRPIGLPPRFTQVVIRGLQGIVNADNRFTIRFNRNFTLRDSVNVENKNVGQLALKNLHEEWKIFRQEQQYNIDRWQWDRVTEAIVGFKLTDVSVRVPSYERELYDEKFNTDTQYGLGDGQAFVNGSLALNSIISYLLDPEVDFNPIDINTFFINNSFDTQESIVKAMDEIYNTFIFANINRMYFSVLKDAFTTKAKYPGIFKTSMVSLHGIRPFQTNGVFDD